MESRMNHNAVIMILRNNKANLVECRMLTILWPLAAVYIHPEANFVLESALTYYFLGSYVYMSTHI